LHKRQPVVVKNAAKVHIILLEERSLATFFFNQKSAFVQFFDQIANFERGTNGVRHKKEKKIRPPHTFRKVKYRSDQNKKNKEFKYTEI
jgi:hypothetical protein